jgi:hypothetical protein
MLCGLTLPKLSAIFFFIIIVADVIVSSIGSTLWFRLNKTTLEYSYLYSQFIIPLAFALTTWCIYFLFHFFKNVYPTIFDYRGKNDDRDLLCKFKIISNARKRKIFRFFNKCLGLTKTPSIADFQTAKSNYGEGDGDIILTGDGNDITNKSGQPIDTIKDQAEFENEYIDKTNYGIWKCYFIFAVFDTIINSLVILPILYFSSVFIIEAGQINLPLNMFGSWLYLGKEYTTAQIISVILVIFGVTLGCYPELSEYWNLNSNSTITTLMTGSDDSLELIGNYTSNNKKSNQIHVIHYIVLFIIFIIVQILCTISSIYKEKNYKKFKLDPIKTVAIVATIQFPLGMLTFPFLSIPLPKPAVYVAPSKYGEYIYNGTSILFNADNGYSLLFVFIGYIFCVVFANIVDFIITQRISSTFNIVNNISVLTLSILFMGWKGLAGEAYQPVSLFSYASVFLIILAIINYWKGTPEAEKMLVKSDGREILNSQALLREGRGVMHPLNVVNGIGVDKNTFFNRVGNFNTVNTQNSIRKNRQTESRFNDTDTSSDDFPLFEVIDGEYQWSEGGSKKLKKTELVETEKIESSVLVDVSNTTMHYNRGSDRRIHHPMITDGTIVVEVVRPISNTDDNK